jgi:CDK inhibitor PHO81
LKKIVSSLAARRPASEAAALALGIRPSDLLTHTPSSAVHLLQDSPVAAHEPPILSTSGQDDDRGPDFQYHKAAFFFKLERELEKVRGEVRS